MNFQAGVYKAVISLFFALIGIMGLKAQNYNLILGRPTDTSMTVSVMFSQAIYQYYLEFGTQAGTYNRTSSVYTSAIDVPDEIDLRQLSPNTRYYYRMRYKLSGAASYQSTPEYNFITQRPPGSSFTFTIEADEHLYDKKGIPEMYDITLQNQALDNPDFMLSLGDIFGDDHEWQTITAYELDTLHKYYRPYLGKICHSIPFYVCLGNHEGERKYYMTRPAAPNNLGINATLARKKYYVNPYPNSFYSGNAAMEGYGVDQPENYYAWTWGDALLVVLDAYRYDSRSDTSNKPQGWDWTLGIPQYQWLKNTLETSNAKYKFVFAHHVRGEGRGGITNAIQCEWGGYQRIATGTQTTGSGYTFPTNRPAAEGWTKPIHQLFRDNNVNIFFQGHDHVFAHEILDSITYQSTPMAADSTYEIGFLANAAAYLSDTLDGTGHLRVTVSPAYAQVDYVKAYLPRDTIGGLNTNRQVAFSYKVRNKNTYVFVGSGNWTDANNWLDKAIPPVTLPAGAYIYIEPPLTGECVLNTTQNVASGGNLIVNPNRKFTIPGFLNMQ